jgi:hypothetical protein
MEKRAPNNSEAWLAKIANSTFLNLWSIPSPFRDQGKITGGDGKEICDLLVVFGDDIIVFSDKDCQLIPTDDLRTGWSRWFKRAVAKSAAQAVGAARWLQSHPRRVWSDPKCTIPLPIALPVGPSVRFHLVVVAHDGLERDGSSVWPSGGLSINTGIVGEAHMDSSATAQASPFAVGRVLSDGPFIHVFDQHGIDLVLGHSDTVSDFLQYLSDREQFLDRSQVVAASEHALLAAYFSHFDAQAERYWFHDPPGIASEPLEFENGGWGDYISSERFFRRQAANRPSYVVDRLIEHFAAHVLRGTAVAGGDSQEVEPALRQLAVLSRTGRRAVGTAIQYVKLKTGENQQGVRVLSVPGSRKRWVAVLALAHPPDLDENQYREFRRGMLHALLLILRCREPDAEDLVGIAFDAGPMGRAQSQDLEYLDGRQWSRQHESRAIELQQRTGLLMNATFSRMTDFDYPDEEARVRPAKLDEPCPCGRPLRFRECCAPRFPQSE